MSNNDSFFNALGDFVARSHRELSAFVYLLQRPMASSEFNGEFSGPAQTRATYRFSEKGLAFTAETVDKRFEVDLPLSADRASEATITLTTKGESEQPAALTGADILDSSRIPEAFQGLHARLARIIRHVLPEELLKSYTGSDTRAAAPQSETETARASTSDAHQGEPSEYVDYVVRRPGEANLRFQGKQLAVASSSLRYGRHFAYEVYQTQAGTYVGIAYGLSAWPNESTRVKTKVTKEARELVELFGHDALAKSIYEQLSLNTDEVVV